MAQEWYPEGLKFGCTQCGNCCTGPPGYVWFTDEEARAMAAGLNLGVAEFLRQFAHTVNGNWTLNEHVNPEGKGYDCTFLRRDDNGKALCSIYETRPHQCRTWPFWPDLLKSKASWERAKQKCPGMDNGKLYKIEQIRIIRDSNES